MMWDQKICNRRGFGATPVVFVLVPLISLGGFLLFSALRNARAPEITPIAIQKQSTRENTSLDSDQDGLKDWEEQIYTTDVYSPDTDGDGTKDGDEIAQGRDPLKKAPKDMVTKIDASAATAASSNAYTGDQFNLTRKIAEEFGRDYVMQIAQNPDSPQNADAFVDKIMQIISEQAPSHATPITTKDIIISRTATMGDVVRYLKQFNTAVLNPSRPMPNMKRISDAMADIVHTEDAARTSAAAKQLALYINQYDQFLADIKTIPVPEDFASLHVDYVNTTIKERDALKKIQNVKNDPFTALMGFKEYTETTKKFNDLKDQDRNLMQDKMATITHQ